jgi:hypothetical protein
MLSLERLFSSDRFRILDFGAGETEYKSRFSTGRAMCADIIYFRWSFRNVVAVAAHALLSLLSFCAGRVLEKMGLKNRLRSFIRQWASGDRPRRP